MVTSFGPWTGSRPRSLCGLRFWRCPVLYFSAWHTAPSLRPASWGTPWSHSNPNPVGAHPELHKLVKHGTHVAGVGPEEGANQLFLLLAQQHWRALCPSPGLPCSPQCQGFCRQDHCARTRDVAKPLRPAENSPALPAPSLRPLRCPSQ